MKNIQNTELRDILSIDTFNDSSLFAVVVIDLSNYQVIYSNQAMKNIMSDMLAENCWEAIHGQDSPCMWCKAPQLMANLNHELNNTQSKVNHKYITYENFNEVANKWYQLQEKVITLEDSRNILISFALDISLQKDAQSKLIDTHVKLAKQTKALQDAQAKLKDLVNLDPLTNIYNRRYFNEVAKNIISLGKRQSKPLSVIMIDIDDFKKINDTYGHNVGDSVIKFLANKLLEMTRESDIVSRFGGEEFAIILPSTELHHALIIAEKIRKNIEESFLEDCCSIDNESNKVQFTISLGIDEFDYNNDISIDSVLNRADKALYKAKESGKNKVCAFN